MKRTFVLAALVALMASCTDQSSATPPAPVHYHVFVYGESMRMEEKAVQDYFYRWLNETGISIPNSSFSLIEIQPDNESSKVLHIVTIPEAWGGHDTQRQTLFLKTHAITIKTLLRGEVVAVGGLAGNEGGMNPGETGAGTVTGAIKLIVIPVRRGGDPSQPEEYVVPANLDNQRPYNLTVVCDLSDSTGLVACNQQELDLAYRYFVRKAIESGGGTFSVWKVGNGRETAKRIAYYQVIESIPQEKLARLLLYKKVIASLNLEMEGKPASAIVQTLCLAADDLRERLGQHVIFLLSDGRHVDVRSSLNLERRVPSPDTFLKLLARNGQCPNLTGIEVYMNGLGTHVSNFESVDDGVLKCWENLFKQCGASHFCVRRNRLSESQLNLGGSNK